MKYRVGILGCGWFGLQLAIELIELGYSVKGSTTSRDKIDGFKKVNVEPYLIDLNNLSEAVLVEFLASIDVLVVTIPPIRNQVENIYAANFRKLLKFIEYSDIKQVVMMSSVSVYAPNKEVVTEDSICFSTEVTAKNILEAEQVFWKETSINACIVRLGGLFGKNREPVNYICNKEFFENPELPVNMIHLDDITRFVTELIESKLPIQTIYNLVSPNYASRFDYYRKRAKICGLELPKLGSNNWSQFKKVSGAKATQELNFNYQY